ncbi:rho GTPase-activating protein 7 [Lingula anatina]|uniref:Rho GTPase-activating protein 7 n=1 Tax=Lingula anatina TaxID=7574 RepID=A0A2R2MQ23_LINAN|nr:rho GTPase-activating protein 7 [Lingula anatina]|eukprot:XP_023932336.1 rho GTPase-activating protein 7 [Lingula anatina]
MTSNRICERDEYSAIEIYLKQAEEELGKALNKLSTNSHTSSDKVILLEELPLKSDENHNNTQPQNGQTEDSIIDKSKLIEYQNEKLKDTPDPPPKKVPRNDKIEVYFPPPPPLSPNYVHIGRRFSSPVILAETSSSSSSSSSSPKGSKGQLVTSEDENRNKRSVSEPPRTPTGGLKLTNNDQNRPYLTTNVQYENLTSSGQQEKKQHSHDSQVEGNTIDRNLNSEHHEKVLQKGTLASLLERPQCNIIEKNINRPKRPTSLDIVSHAEKLKPSQELEEPDEKGCCGNDKSQNGFVSNVSAVKSESNTSQKCPPTGKVQLVASNETVVMTTRKVSRATQTEEDSRREVWSMFPRTPLEAVVEVDDDLMVDESDLGNFQNERDSSTQTIRSDSQKQPSSILAPSCRQQVVVVDVHVNGEFVNGEDELTPRNTPRNSEERTPTNSLERKNAHNNQRNVHFNTPSMTKFNTIANGSVKQSVRFADNSGKSPAAIQAESRLEFCNGRGQLDNAQKSLVGNSNYSKVQISSKRSSIHSTADIKMADKMDSNVQYKKRFSDGSGGQCNNISLESNIHDGSSYSNSSSTSTLQGSVTSVGNSSTGLSPEMGTPQELLTPTSLLDSMHKKFYAHQYMQKSPAQSEADLCQTEHVEPKALVPHSLRTTLLANGGQASARLHSPDRPALGISGKAKKHVPGLSTVMESHGQCAVILPTSHSFNTDSAAGTPDEDVGRMGGSRGSVKSEEDEVIWIRRIPSGNTPCTTPTSDTESVNSSQHSLTHCGSKQGSAQHKKLEAMKMEKEVVLRSKTPPLKRADNKMHLPADKAHTLPGTGVQNKKSFQQYKTEREQAEIEAVEACRWLKAAGFPQYAQMYEDLQFPIDVDSAEQDHDFLDRDSIQSLFRRLNILNKCASMKIETPPRQTHDESDDEEQQCALSDKWKYQRTSRRWSRKDGELQSPEERHPSDNGTLKKMIGSCSSHDSVLTDNDDSQQGDSPVLHHKENHDQFDRLDLFITAPKDYPEKYNTLSTQRQTSVDGAQQKLDGDTEQSASLSASLSLSPRLRRAASEKIKGARNFLNKKMGTLKTKKRRRPLDGAQISGPVLIDSPEVQERIQRLGCVDISPTSEGSPLLNQHLPLGGASSPKDSSDSDTSPLLRAKNATTIQELNEVQSQKSSTSNGDIATASADSEDNDTTAVTTISTDTATATTSTVKRANSGSQLYADKESASNDFEKAYSTMPRIHEPIKRRSQHGRSNSDVGVSLTEEMYILPADHKPGTFPIVISNGVLPSDMGSASDSSSFNKNYLTASPVMRDKSSRRKAGGGEETIDASRMSIYDNVHFNNISGLTPQEELDMILNNLFDEINGLNRSLSETGLVSQEEDSRDVSTASSDTMEGRCESPASPIQPRGDSIPPLAEELITMEVDTDVVSGTSSTHETSDQEGHSAGSDADVTENPLLQERRDSGVGSSLTRTPSNERRRPRIRWHSFQKSHRPSLNSRSLQISNLSAGQLMVLRKLSLLKLTAFMEKYSPSNRTGWNWVIPKFIKRFKAPDYKDKNVFGVPLLLILQRTGQPLPQCILYAMRHLRRTATDAVGIFRKSGVRSRIQKLRNQIEASLGTLNLVNFDALQAYDVADLLKQYFRELPECLLTNKLSETFISIFQHVPSELRMEAVQAAVILMPDENREVLQSLLLFLSDMAEHSEENQMTASNLAVCFAPSLFHMCGPRSNQTASPKRQQKNLGVPDQKELLEQKAAHECLTQMIMSCKKVFTIEEDTMMKCNFSYMEQGDPVTLNELTKGFSNHTTYIDSCIQGLLRESRDKFKGWEVMTTNESVEVAYKKVGDGHPLRLFKAAVDVEAPPIEVLNRVLRERHLWDDDLLKWRIIEKLDKETEIFQYVRNSMAPHPTRDFCELRSWRTDLPKGACVLVSTSIEHPNSNLLGGVRAVVLASRYLLEPCGSGKSRLTHLARVDMRGRSPEWYNKAYGHICASYISRIRDSFKQNVSDGPETKL